MRYIHRGAQAGATKPTGPDARHNDSAVVLARTVIAFPAPGSRAKTRLSPGCTGTLTSGPSDSVSVIEPSLLARELSSTVQSAGSSGPSRARRAGLSGCAK